MSVSRASSDTTISATGTFQRRVMRRISGVIVVVATALIIGAVVWVQTTTREDLRQSSEVALAVLTVGLEAEIEEPVREVIGLAVGSTLRNYAHLTSVSAEAEFNLQQTELQADVLRSFDELISRRRDRYLAVRYITREGLARGEVINLGTETEVITAPGFTNYWTNAAYVASITQATAGTAFLGPVTRTPDGTPDRLTIYAPVAAVGSMTTTGVIQMEVAAAPVQGVIQAALEAAPVAQPGRRILVLDSANRILADTGGINSAAITQFLGENDGDFIQRFMAGDVALSARTVDRFSGLNMPWRIVLVDNILAATQHANLLSILLAAGGAVGTLLMLGLVQVLLRPMFRPLAEANQLIQTLAQGQTPASRDGHSAADGPTAHDELGSLMHSIDGVSQRIADLSHSLETRVGQRTRELEVAAHIGREIATIYEIDRLLNRAINLICDEFGYYHAQVYLVDDARVNAVLAYSRGEPGQLLLERNHKLAIGSQSIIGAVTGSGEPVIVNDTQQPGSPHKVNPLLPETRAEMGLPLRIGGEVIGALDIQSTVPDVFDEEDLATFSLLADQLAVAIYNARLLSQTEERVREVDRLNRQLTRTAWEGAEQYTDLKRGYRYNLLNVEPDEGETVQHNGESGAVVSSPISIRGQVIGTLNAAPGEGQEFTEGDQVILRAVANRVALAIENARLFQETQFSLSETSALYQLSRNLNEANSLEDIIRAIIRSMITEASGGQIWIFDEHPPASGPQWMSLVTDVALAEREQNDTDLSGLRLHLPDHPLLRELRSDQIALINNTRQDARLDSGLQLIFRRLRARAAVWIPLTVRGVWRGMITIEFDKARRFTEREGRIYSTLIDQAGVAIDNRLLLRQTEAEVARNENLYAASRIINTAQTPQDLIQAAAATSEHPDLHFALSMLEGELNENGWPGRARMLARSDGMNVEEVSLVYPLHIAAGSPILDREPETVIDDIPSSQNVSSAVEFMRWLGFRFMVVFPLFSANQPIALFYALSKEPVELAASDYEVYRALTGQMSSQLQIRQLLQRTEAALDETSRLYIASRAITSAQDTEEVYREAVDHLSHSLLAIQRDLEDQPLLRFAVWMAWPESSPDAPYLENVYLWDSISDTGTIPAETQRVPSQELPYGRLTAEADGAVYLPDVAAADADEILAWEQELQSYLRQEYPRGSLLILPVRTRQRWFGVLTCHSESPQAFGEQYQRFVQAVTDQVAIAVENQRLFDEARFEAERAQAEAQRALALAEAAQLASRIGEDFRTSLDEVFQRVAEVARLDRWMLVLFDGSGARLEAQVAHGPDIDDSEEFVYELETQIPIIDAARLNQTLVINDPAGYPALADCTEDELAAHCRFFGKHIATPVVTGRQMLGALFMGRGIDTADLHGGDQQLVTTLATQVAVALENRRLFQQARNEQQTLRSILETLPAGVLVLDAHTLKPLQSNEQAIAYLGDAINPNTAFTVSDYGLYRTGTEMLYPDDEMPIFAALKEGAQRSCDDVAVLLGHRQIDLLIDAAPIIDSEGSITSVVAVFQDITNLRSLENTLQENLRETVSLYEAQRQFSEATDINDLLDVILGQMAMLEPSDAFVLLRDERERVYTSRHLATPPAEPERLAAVMKPRAVTFILDTEDANLDQDAREAFRAIGARAMLSVPLRAGIRESNLGWLVVVNTAPDSFKLDQERILQQLGDMASTALENRLLLQRQQETVQEVLTLYEATNAVSHAHDLTQISDVLQVALGNMNPDYVAGYLAGDTEDEDVELFNIAEEGLPPVDFAAILTDYTLLSDGIYIDDLAALEDPGPMEQKLLEAGLRAIAAIDLRPRETPGGFLVAAYRQPQQFTESDNRYLNTIADGASVVFSNIVLFDQIQNTLEETSILYQASRALSDAVTPEDILDVVVNYLIQPHIGQVFIAMLRSRTWDADGATVEIVSSWHDGEGIDLTGITMTAEQFPAWGKLATPEVLTIDDIFESADLSPLEQVGIEGLDTRSVAIIPLRTPQRAIGAIWIGSREVHIHRDREERIYQAFSESASLSMEASYLIQQTERRARQLETSAEVSRSAGSLLELEVLLPRLVHLIREAFSYDHAQVFLMDDADEYAELRASTGEAGRQLLEVRHKLAKGSDSVIGMVTATGQPQIALDTADADVIHQPNMYLPMTRSEMALPLIVKGQVIGALDVQSNEPNAFSDDDLRALTTLASQISVAIENANLYAAAQEQADKMGFLFEVTTAATAAETLDEALQNVAERLYESLNALSVTIYLPRVYADDRGNSYTTLAAVALQGIDQPLTEIEEIRADDPEHLFSQVGRNLKPFVIDNVATEPRYLPVVSSARSAVLLPLTTATEMIGLIVMEDRRIKAYEYDILQLLLTLSGSLSAVVQSIQLLEQLQKTNEQLRELDRLKSDFLANMSHELRTPLNSIIGFSRVMLKGIDGPLTEMQEQDLTTIYNSGQHLLMLINDVLDQAKIAAGKMDLKFAYFEVKPLVEAVKSIGVGLVKDKPINLMTEIAPNLTRAYGDEFRTRQVLLNLVSNAAKFTTEGSITIRVYPVQDEDTGRGMIRVDVIDTGVGLDKKDLPLLFEAFRQVDSSLTRTQGGTGLGLPIAKTLVEMQGGQMLVTSQVNEGSTFSIVIPTQPTVEAAYSPEDDAEDDITPVTRPTAEIRLHPAMAEKAPQVMPARREVLLIEDNKDMVDQFRRVLQREGFEVTTADHPAYAEAMVSNMRPTVIIMDVNFSDSEGWNILSQLKDRDDTFDIPVIVVTLSDESERAYQAGAFHFLQRPFVPEDLIEAVLAAEKESNTERILIIDDQPEAIRLLTQLLNENGTYRVFSARSGAEGISLVARRRPDLVILDLRMPEMDGFAVLEELRSNPETANIPVMVVTGDVDLNADEQALLANVHVLPKTDISLEEYRQFIKDVRKHLNLHEEK